MTAKNLLNAVLLLLAVTYFLTSCETKQTPINKLTDMTEDLRKNADNYTETDWQELETKLQAIEQEINTHQGEYTDEEKKQIGKLKGTCLWYETKHAARSFKQNMKDALQEAQGVIEGFTDEATK